ncbi:unnamed protein product [Mytilus coruscus]|uniref:Retrotransposon gag domain-containing protein n=1 Tax=Mytilus coruscus TaxID=42192 RepID=A0A6J8BAZ6_MYTCO|nr:unnamed protein product [Mytilus coruscus]
MNQSGSDDENFYLNPTFLSFNNISDKSVLSDTFLNKNYLGETPITRSDSDSSFAEKYLVVQTPETPEIDPIQPYFTKTVLSHAEIDEQIVSARQNIKFNSESLKKVTFSTSTPSIINSSSKYRSIAVMEKLGTCRKFAGYPKDNGTKFLREFESFCKLHELDILNEKTVAAFHLHLEGPALTWFNGLSPDLSWTTVKRLFTDKYVQIGWQHPSVVIESETFHNMQLGPTQEIEDFSCQVLEKGQILAKPEHEIMVRFINGLPEKLAFYVRTMQIIHGLNVSISGQTYIEPGVPYNVSCTVDEYRDNRKTTFFTTQLVEKVIVWYYKPYGCFLWSNATATDCRNASCACDDNGLTTHWTYETPLNLSPSVMFRCFTTDNDSRIINSDLFEAKIPCKLQILLTSTIRDLIKV